MFRTRLLSGVLLVIIALATIMAGDGILAVILCLVSLIAYRELIRACGVHTEGIEIQAEHTEARGTTFWVVHRGNIR